MSAVEEREDLLSRAREELRRAPAEEQRRDKLNADIKVGMKARLLFVWSFFFLSF